MITLTQAVRLLGLQPSDGVYLVLQPGCDLMDCAYLSVREMRHKLEMNKIFVTHIDPNHYKYTWDSGGCEFTVTAGSASETRELLRRIRQY